MPLLCNLKNTYFPMSCKSQPVRLQCNFLRFSLLLVIVSLLYSIVHESTNERHTAFAESVSPSDFNFAAVGDWACTEDTEETVANIINKDPELILGLGDYVYPNTPADCWFDIVDPIDEKMKIAVGNHDSDELSPLMLHFNLSEQFYSFNYQNVHFLIMSTEIPFHTDSEQFEFVSTDLSKASENPDIDWIFVFMHKMLYSSPARISTSFQDPLRTTYHPLFDKYGVDLVIQGHFHIYERTYPLNFNSLTEDSPQVVDATSGNNYTNPKGPVFITVGTGGAELHPLERESPYTITHHSGFGVLDVAVLKDGSTIDAKFYANGGTIEDEFTIMKTNSSSSSINNKTANSLYHFTPYITLSGSNYTDIEASLQPAQFSVAAWFNVHGYSDGYIVNSPNFGIWMEDDGRIQASYETDEGDSVRIVSPNRYNDNKWHHAVITYDGSSFNLYIDSVLTAYRTSTSAPEDNGIQPIRIGESFIGSIDELRIWNRALSPAEIEQGHSPGKFDSTDQVLYLPDLTKSDAR